MKDDLKGRIIGFSTPYRLDPSQIEPGDPEYAERTIWADVTFHNRQGGTLLAECRHTGEEWWMEDTSFHTLMPAGYPNSNS